MADTDYTVVLGRSSLTPAEEWVDRYAPGAGRYKDVKCPPGQGITIAATAAGVNLVYVSGVIGVAGANSAVCAFDFDPADYAINTKTTKCMLKLLVIPNAVAPAITLVSKLYPVATTGGGSAAPPTIASLGTAAGSVQIVNPAAAQPTTAQAKFTAPTSGVFALSIEPSGAMAANAQFTFWLRLLAGAE